MNKLEPYHVPSVPLARLLDPPEEPQDLWREDELAGMWRHQLATPLAWDLGWPESVPAGRATFADTLLGPDPDLGTLEEIKQYGKSHWLHPSSPLPRGIALALYHAAIAAARLRHGHRLSALPEDAWREGLNRVLAMDWLDESTRDLFRRALADCERPGD